jgi:hypothetical protein
MAFSRDLGYINIQNYRNLMFFHLTFYFFLPLYYTVAL